MVQYSRALKSPWFLRSRRPSGAVKGRLCCGLRLSAAARASRPCGNWVWSLARKAGEASGLKVNAHDLRHTFAAQLVASGASLYAVSRFMGHANIGITVSVYGSWLPPEDTEALDRYAERLLLAKPLSTTAHKPVNSSDSEEALEGSDSVLSAT